MKVEVLKEKARRHEQKEDWQKALNLYLEAIEKHDEDELPDITLYNRVGDLQTRLGQVDGAVASYEKAIELYLEAELPNNAIAVCKKVLRNLPDRSIFFLRMGQIRGGQGFLTDARQNFLIYAEQLTAAGDMDTALDALVEFVALSPEDLEIRLGLASQLEAQGRVEAAAAQYLEGYRQLILQDRDEEAQAMADKVRELAPDTMLPDPQSVRAGVAAHADEKPVAVAGGLAGLELVSEPKEEEEKAAPIAEPVAAGEDSGGFEIGGVGEDEVETEAVEEEAAPLPGLSSGEEEGAVEEEEEALPTFGFDTEEEDEEDEEVGEPLPILSFDDDKEEVHVLGAEDFGEADHGDRESKEYVEEEKPLPELDVSLEEISLDAEAEEAPAEKALEEAMEDAAFEAAVEAPEPAAEAPEPAEAAAAPPVEEAPPVRSPASYTEAAERGDLDLAMIMLRAQIGAHPDEVTLYQRMVEYAFRKADHAVLIPAYMELAVCLIRIKAPAKAKAIYQQVLSLSPGHEGAQEGLQGLAGAPGKVPIQVASSEEYVDLGSMILGEEGEKATRWQITTDAPSGDDQADFAKMLSQFKQKVSEHVDADDVSAHHDLGTAYMEMGLLDEAISEFQTALRASPGHLPTHEVMGRCWMEAKNPEMASRALARALEVEAEVEDELIGIYFLMGRAQEDLGNTSKAVEFYDKVFSLDINFEDVTERLRALRKD